MEALNILKGTIMKITRIVALCACALALPACGQQKIFNWIPANDETVRLDPAFYHNGRTYHPGPEGGNIHVDIDAQRPVTIAMTAADEWSRAVQRPERFGELSYSCVEQHVMKATYTCHLPPQPMVIVIHDERPNEGRAVGAAVVEMGEVLSRANPIAHAADHAMTAGVSAVLSAHPPTKFVAPNDVHIQYYSWSCIENCIQPEFQWVRQVKEKYELTDILKVYGGITPDHDGEEVSIKVKSPVPMAVAILPAKTAGQLYGKPDALESAIENSQCQQRGVQSSTFQCVINLADGPQALILLPEPTSKVHSHKKAEIEVQAVKCIANCTLLTSQKEE